MILDLHTSKPLSPLPEIGEVITRYRSIRGIRQKDLASALGISGKVLSSWETGRTRPDISMAPQICHALGISLAELYGTDDPVPGLTGHEETLLKDYRTLPDNMKHYVGKMIHELVIVSEDQHRPRRIPLLYFEHGLAAGVDAGTDFQQKGSTVWVEETPETRMADYIFPVNGDSMEPDYHEGDLVLVRKQSTKMDYGKVGAFTVGNEQYIKLFEPDGLHSLNPAFRTLTFGPDENVYLIGEVIGTISPEDIVTLDQM